MNKDLKYSWTHIIYLQGTQDDNEYRENVREMVCCLIIAFIGMGRCDGQMGGLTELSALLAAQTFVECQPKLLKHGNRTLLYISHREKTTSTWVVKMHGISSKIQIQKK